MSMDSARRTVARPLIMRRGGTHEVDLAVDGETATRGMIEDYSYEDQHGDRITTYRPQPGANQSPLSGYAFGVGNVTVDDPAGTDGGVLEDEFYPSPAEADGHNQNDGGGMDEVPRTGRKKGFID